MSREAKVVGFALLLVVIFLGAHAAGARLGPVTTSHTQVSYTGPGPGLWPGSGGTSGMDMGR